MTPDHNAPRYEINRKMGKPPDGHWDRARFPHPHAIGLMRRMTDAADPYADIKEWSCAGVTYRGGPDVD